MTEDKPRVLFVGDRNAGRSVIAERVLTMKTHGAVEARSAGVVSEGPHPLSVRVLREISIDAADHQPHALKEVSIFNFDLVVTFGPQARARFTPQPVAPAANGAPPEDPAATIVGLLAPLHIHWDVPDPGMGASSSDGVARFRDARDQIAARIDSLVRHGYLDALREQRGRLVQRIDRSTLGLVALDAHARLFLLNAKAERLIGRTRAEVLGLHCRQVFPPDGICGAACLFSGKSGCPDTNHEHLVGVGSPSGATRPFRVQITPLHGGGIPSRVTVAALYDTNGMPVAPRTRNFHGMVGKARALQEAIALIRQVARSDYPVLITGESGTGKELAAQAIHLESRHRGGPFVPINCGALPEHILESELFGHVKGAFTGAIRDKKGRFELADGGTLLLDEVGELSPAFQVKLLRVLQEKRFERVGGERPVAVDVRVISSTHRDLRRLVREGTFREDLFYRLAVVPMAIPPLRERLEDLPILVEHILSQIRKDAGKDLRRAAPEAMDLLRAYPWPGNVRELINALQFASVHCRGDEIRSEHLPPEISGQPTPVFIEEVDDETERETGDRAPDSMTGPTFGPSGLTPENVAEAIARAGGNKLKAAKLLGIGRATLYRFLDRHSSTA